MIKVVSTWVCASDTRIDYKIYTVTHFFFDATRPRGFINIPIFPFFSFKIPISHILYTYFFKWYFIPDTMNHIFCHLFYDRDVPNVCCKKNSYTNFFHSRWSSITDCFWDITKRCFLYSWVNGTLVHITENCPIKNFIGCHDGRALNFSFLNEC